MPRRVGLRVVGELEPFWIPVSNFRVTPILALADRLQTWAPDPREVAASSRRRLRPSCLMRRSRCIERDVREWRIRYGAYPLHDARVTGTAVWGATARILGQLGAMLGNAVTPPA